MHLRHFSQLTDPLTSHSPQISDVDAHKCREGRLDYLGCVSFFLIAAPMTILLLNEAVGTALIGAAIPSIYSSLLIGGAYLFRMSLFAMLLPYCFLIGVPCYITFVYRASIIAYAKRASDRRRAVIEGIPRSAKTGFRSKNKNRKHSHDDVQQQKSAQAMCSGYVLRLLRALYHAFQDTVAFFSPYHFSVRRARAIAETMTWRNMNMPRTAQGTVRPRTKKSECRSPTAAKPMPKVLKKMRSLKFTPMLSACDEVSPNLDGVFSEVDDGEDGEKIDTDFSVMLESNSEQLEVPLDDELEGSKKLPRLNSLIVFETEEALSMMRRKLTMHNSTRGSQEVLTNVITADLMEEFKEVLEIFYPHGVAMTESEKEEACKLFGLWRDKQNARNNVSFVEASTDDVPMASFPQFESWFSVNLIRTMHSVKANRIKEIEDQRLIDEAKRKSSRGDVSEVKSPLSNLFPDGGATEREEKGKWKAKGMWKDKTESSMTPLEVIQDERASKSKSGSPHSSPPHPSPNSSRPAVSSRIWPIP